MKEKIDNIKRRVKSEHQKDVEYARKHSPNIKGCIKLKMNKNTTIYFKKGTTWHKIQEYINKLNAKTYRHG